MKNVVLVQHGLVHYSDHVAEVLDAVAEPQRATVLPFIKRQSFSWQREYRFTVSVIGSPKENTYRLAIHSSLRELTHPWRAA